MFKSKTKTEKNVATIWILLGIPVIILMGSLMHFVYAWSGNLTIVGIFDPVNESVWEHLKMAFWPVLFWWFLGYLIYREGDKISVNHWFFSCAISAMVCPLFIVTFYYTYTGAFGIHSLLLDIASLFLSIITGQLAALHVYNYAKPNKCCLYCAYALVLLIALAFVIFTFLPPHIPLFLDFSTGNYGI